MVDIAEFFFGWLMPKEDVIVQERDPDIKNDHCPGCTQEWSTNVAQLIESDGSRVYKHGCGYSIDEKSYNKKINGKIS